MNDQLVKRRTFLKSMAACSLCTGTAGLLLGKSQLVSANTNELTIDKSVFDKDKTVLLKHPDYKYPISVLYIGGDKFTALLMMCTHQKCKTEWNKDHYICPCHGSRFNETGEVIRGMALEKLKSFPVKVDDNKVIVQLS